MTRSVFCTKYQQTLEGLGFPPFPGERGKKIFDEVSKKAWLEWLQHQTMLINEKKLNLLEPSTQIYLKDQFEKFIHNELFDRAEGYVAPKNK